MKRIFFFALLGAFVSVAATASAQSTVTNVAAPTAREASGVAPKQTNDNSGRGNTVKQAQTSAAASSPTRGSRGAAAKTNTRAVNENAKAAPAKAPATTTATKTK